MGKGLKMEQDAEQNSRIRDLETRLNSVENDISAILAKLEQASGLLKIVGLALAASIGIDVQGLM
tara:strand:+ start:638 stop:832 length:195 start_codon:yes stop_codon:yes gene_type:complete